MASKLNRRDRASFSYELATQIHPIFEANGWTYANAGDGHENGVPTVKRLAETIDSLIYTTESEGSLGCSSGRIRVDRQRESGFKDRIRVYLELHADPFEFVGE